MCGLIGGALPLPSVIRGLDAIAHRGPDDQGAAESGAFALGHTRLAVQDVTSASAQPWPASDGSLVTYNGEAWRPDALRALLPERTWSTTGDTEVVAELLAAHGTEALPLLDRAMFALAWVDREGLLHLARDRYGEVPLHVGRLPGSRIAYASEVAALLQLGAHPATIQWLLPGHVMTVQQDGRTATVSRWAAPEVLTPSQDGPRAAAAVVRHHLMEGVTDRLTGDVPIAVLVSGGLDSSLVLGIIRTMRPDLEVGAYTAVHNPRSLDLAHARAVCGSWGIPLREVPVPAPTAADLARTVRAVEQPHKAQVEIGWACLHLARAIRRDGYKVVLSGEGSDELWASYGSPRSIMVHHGIKTQGWHQYRASTFTGQHRKNFARTNKVFMRHGIEARLPFLDPGLVGYALTLPEVTVTRAAGGRTHTKAVLAAAAAGLVPETSVWRAKVAFQVGAGLDLAVKRAVPDPRRLYAAEFRTAYGGVKP